MSSARQSGFTLLEALVSGVISIVLAGSMLSILYMGSDVVTSGAGYAKVSELQVVAASQIMQTTRAAYAVKIGTDASHSPLSSGVLSNDPIRPGQKEIMLIGRLGDTLGGYRIRPAARAGALGYLEEWDTAASPNDWRVFSVGGDTVHLVEPRSSFAVWPRRRGVDFRLLHAMRIGEDTLTLARHTERALCRNQSR